MRTIPILPVEALSEFEKIQARSISGVFSRWRWAMVWLTQLVFYGLPWWQLQGQQAVLFDLAGGRFFLFGAVLYPQDLVYLSGLLMICALLLFADCLYRVVPVAGAAYRGRSPGTLAA